MKNLIVLLLVCFTVVFSQAQVLYPNLLPKPKSIQNTDIDFLDPPAFQANQY